VISSEIFRFSYVGLPEPGKTGNPTETGESSQGRQTAAVTLTGLRSQPNRKTYTLERLERVELLYQLAQIQGEVEEAIEQVKQAFTQSQPRPFEDRFGRLLEAQSRIERLYCAQERILSHLYPPEGQE
jgi:hypothetical protein